MDKQRQWLFGIVESAPSLIFVGLWRSGFDLETAGWIGTGLTSVALLALRFRRQPYDTILLGINLHILISTPIISTTYRTIGPTYGDVLLYAAQNGVVVSIALVGLGLAIFSDRGFVGASDLVDRVRRHYSLLLLAAAAAGAVWSLLSTGGPLLAIALPIVCLFALRNFLIARGTDRVEAAKTDG